jgi:hypothetical protein
VEVNFLSRALEEASLRLLKGTPGRPKASIKRVERSLYMEEGDILCMQAVTMGGDVGLQAETNPESQVAGWPPPRTSQWEACLANRASA